MPLNLVAIGLLLSVSAVHSNGRCFLGQKEEKTKRFNKTFEMAKLNRSIMLIFSAIIIQSEREESSKKTAKKRQLIATILFD